MSSLAADKVSGAGIEMKPAHFPGRAPIDTYGAGGFRFAEMSHKGSILCLPSGIHGWQVSAMDQLTPTSLSILKDETGLEVLLIGTGVEISPISEKTRKYLSSLSIRSDAMSTGAAARTYNVLLAEGRAVGAALLAVE